RENRREGKPSSKKGWGALRTRPEKEGPSRNPKFPGWGRPVRQKDQPHKATTPHSPEPHPASRMADPPSEWRPYAATQSGPLLSPLSENLAESKRRTIRLACQELKWHYNRIINPETDLRF